MSTQMAGYSDKSHKDPYKIPPHSIEAEQSVLGGLMIDNSAWERISDKLSADDFYRNEHRLLYRALEQLAANYQPFDVVTVSETLKNSDELTVVGGEVYLFELTNNTPSAANISAYADIVRERSVLRQLVNVSTSIAENAYHPSGRNCSEILDEAERKVFEIANQHTRGSGPRDINHVISVTLEKLETLRLSNGELTGKPTGFIDFDKMTAGLQDSDLIIVAGRPSMGKTVFALNLAEAVAIKTDKPVLIFSMEMPAESLVMRMLSSLGAIEQTKIRTGQMSEDEWTRVASTVALLSQKKIFIDDTPSLSPVEMRARARRVAREHGELGLIAVDYLQLMRLSGNTENRATEISEISRSLKALAKELSVPVVALSQLNRSLEQRSDKRPVMSDLRESGAIEQDADLIVFIYRDEVYDENSPHKGIAEIIIGKQRNGPIGKVRLTFQGRFMRFDNYTPEQTGHHNAFG